MSDFFFLVKWLETIIKKAGNQSSNRVNTVASPGCYCDEQCVSVCSRRAVADRLKHGGRRTPLPLYPIA